MVDIPYTSAFLSNLWLTFLIPAHFSLIYVTFLIQVHSHSFMFGIPYTVQVHFSLKYVTFNIQVHSHSFMCDIPCTSAFLTHLCLTFLKQVNSHRCQKLLNVL